jgi:hypothetical protein
LKRWYEAWIYGAEFSCRRVNHNPIEVVATLIKGFSPGGACVLRPDRFPDKCRRFG